MGTAAVAGPVGRGRIGRLVDEVGTAPGVWSPRAGALGTAAPRVAEGRVGTTGAPNLLRGPVGMEGSSNAGGTVPPNRDEDGPSGM